ncbi:MAG TPA: PSD1 and planctomycete cytochrome C domain-containing protein [Tepidisphaeraceae bacterium]|nr:PSD1 and planctomycete cytochrome C domain-containing protein [Tepidisphaeraceae bacterium]
MHRLLPILCAIAFIAPPARAADIPPAHLAFFEKDVRPLLIKHCYSCHSADAKKAKGGLLLDTRAGLLKGGDTGPALVPGDPDKSLIIRAVRHTDPLLQMPEEKLSKREIDALTEWVRIGAPDPRDGAAATLVTAKPAITDEHRKWWSFQPVADPKPPAVRDTSWPATDTDRFVLAKLESQRMRPAPPADKRTLIRRATFDLTGLPPTPAEVDAFLADESPTAFASVVDRLLASKAYGERWGRHWLDLVRYADTAGCNADVPVPDAWRYRNYVIDSFNADKPYDRFIREQLAGDLLPADSEEQRHQQIIATGYLPISRRFSSVAEEFHLTLDDTLDNFSKAFLGLTLSCSRCHDHKFDPIPQADYYALYGIFQSTTYAFPGTEIYRHRQHLTPLVPKSRTEPGGDLHPLLAKMRDQDAEMFLHYDGVELLDTKEKGARKAKFRKVQEARDALLKTLPEYPTAYAAYEGKPANARVHLKGDVTKPGPEVPRGFLQILGGQKVPADEKGSGRLHLANWITDPANPLTARVIVNRIWLHHFGGRGLVRTPDDFGTRGAPPTHPELLDHLAKHFIASGWRFKPMHRQIMLSRAYQQAAIENTDYAKRDPQNESLWTYNRRRLSAEEIRDSMLLVSGALDPTPGGPHPFKPELNWRYSQHNPFVDDFPTDRRSVYMMQQRIRFQPFLGTFDGADTNAVTGLRRSDTTPQQALFMLNSALIHKQADRLAQRLEKESSDPADRVRRAYLLSLGRPATQEEVEEAVAFVRERNNWPSLFRVLLSSNEFVFVE